MYSHVRKKEKMQNIQKLDTNNVLAMARVIDKTDYFDQDYQRLIESLPGRNVPKELKELTSGDTPYRPIGNAIGNFYNRNKKTINTILQTTDIESFLDAYYDETGKHKEASSGTTFFQYLKRHQNQQAQITDTLEKIKELGFPTIEMDLEQSLLQEYSISPNLYGNKFIAYARNIKALRPTEENSICYQIDSPYVAILYPKPGKDFEQPPRLIVTSLTFPKNQLPETISVTNAFAEIQKKQKEHEQEELSIALALYKNITEVSTAVSNLIKLAEVSENIPDRRRFLNTLSEMRSKAIVLKQTRSACIEDLEDTYPGISRDEVEKGKDEIKRLVRKKEYRPNRRG